MNGVKKLPRNLIETFETMPMLREGALSYGRDRCFYSIKCVFGNVPATFLSTLRTVITQTPRHYTLRGIDHGSA